MPGNVFTGSWGLAEDYLSPVFSLCSSCSVFPTHFPSSRDSDLLLDGAISDTDIFKEKDSLIDGNLVVLPSCFPELEFLIRARKDSLKRKWVIQAQSNETVHVQANFQKRP